MFSSFLKAAKEAVEDVVEEVQHKGGDGGEAASAAHQGQSLDKLPVAPRDANYPDDNPVPLSDLTGQKKAVFIGINYFGSSAELHGCVNDVQNIKQFVTQRFAIPGERTLTLTDDLQDPKFRPTRENIMAACRWLVEGAKSGDSLFLHYSGHGGTQTDTDGDEADGHDETILPVDFEKTGQITDDELHAVLVKGLPAGVRLTCIFDSCHSGSVMDLPYTYNIDGNLEVHEVDNRKLAIQAAISAGMSYMRGDRAAAMQSGMSAVKHFFSGPGNSEAHQKALETRSTLADVIQFSGCRDEQTSADASFDGRAQGAMSYAFIQAFSQLPDASYTSLLGRIREIMNGKFSQVPQLSTGHKMDMTSRFAM
eukprot:m.152544 g.152544  ORF g.152544 m.152544 type:complete len:366 (-) comp20731_c1_seq2:31-1128(-)